MVGKKAETEKKYPKIYIIKLLNSIEILVKVINKTAEVPKNKIILIEFFDS